MEDAAGRISGELARRHSTATVLLHHAVAEALGLGPSDHKCLDLLRERGAMTGSELAAAIGLTTGAVTGIVQRLERSGRIRREPHPEDGRKQVLRPVEDGLADIRALFADLGADVDRLLDGFDDHQLAAIAEYLTRATAFARERTALLRARRATTPGGTGA